LIIDDEVRETKTQNINKTFDTYLQVKQSEHSETFSKSEFNETCKIFFKTNATFRGKEKEDSEALIKAREHLKNEFQAKFDCEKSIHHIIQTAHSGMIDIPHALVVYKDSLNLIYPKTKQIEVLFNIICQKKEEMLRNDLKKFTNKDKNIILKHLEEIEVNKLKISEEVMHKLKELSK
jgi:hypothetical protein